MWKQLIMLGLFTLSTAVLGWTESAPDPAGQTAALPATLPPDMFSGQVRQAYQIATDMPEVLAELNCHCGCDKSQGHRHLLDCFSDDHAVG
jgi:hypothetical protein